jgi:hypothetical protein
MFGLRRVKNDERDAADLADLLRMGRLSEAWIAPPATRELRGWVRHRAKLVDHRDVIGDRHPDSGRRLVDAYRHTVVERDQLSRGAGAAKQLGDGDARADDLTLPATHWLLSTPTSSSQLRSASPSDIGEVALPGPQSSEAPPLTAEVVAGLADDVAFGWGQAGGLS